MHSSLGTGDLLVRKCGSWEKIMVDQRNSGSIFKQVKRLGLVTDLSHDLHACGSVVMHITSIREMHSSLGTGDILVRMCGSWEKIMVDQRSSGSIFKKVKRSGLLMDLSHALRTCGSVLMHIDIIRGMYTRLGRGDILVRMCGSWEKIMVDQGSSGRIFRGWRFWRISSKLRLNQAIPYTTFSSNGPSNGFYILCSHWKTI